MTEFIHGRDLCRSFYSDAVRPILDRFFPNLRCSAALIGYGSDVLGYDDLISTDHMWGPRLHLFVRESDLSLRGAIFDAFGACLPHTYRGFSVHFTPPDQADHGVRRPVPVEGGRVEPLIFFDTWEDYLTAQLGYPDPASLTEMQWLSISEHRLLSLVMGEFYRDDLGCAGKLVPLRFYPAAVRLYLIASQWDIIASEQAFARRCADTGDDAGSRILTARIAERLMRLCFLYRAQYAPYPKWLGTAFACLNVSESLKRAIGGALCADSPDERERALTDAQLACAVLHNESGLTPLIDVRESDYYGRPIRVIHAENLAAAALDALGESPLARLPLIGSLTQLGGLSEFTDDPARFEEIAAIYALLSR